MRTIYYYYYYYYYIPYINILCRHPDCSASKVIECGLEDRRSIPDIGWNLALRYSACTAVGSIWS
jgi:hypothetical protein